MGRLADRVMKFLIHVAPWYRPAEVAAREARLERVTRMSARIRHEAELAEQRLR